MVAAGGSSCIIAGMGLQRFPLGGFLGGMNLVDNPYALRSGEAQLATDVDIGLRDVLGSRKGFSSTGLAGSVLSQTKTAATASTAGTGAQAAWNTPMNGRVIDGSSTNAGVSTAPGFFFPNSQRLELKEFGFTIPEGATILGIAVKVKRGRNYQSGGGGLKDLEIRLLKSGVVAGENKASAEEWPMDTVTFGNLMKEVTYGGSETLWGTTWTRAQINSTTFGFRLSVQCINNEQFNSALVDGVEVTVYYLVEGFGADRADHLRPWYTGAVRNLMISANGKIKRLKSGVITTLFEGTAGTTWSMEQMEYNPGTGYKDYMWFMNGVDTPKKWDGTTFANWEGGRPAGNMLRVWKNRMIVSGVAAFPQRVYFSDIANPGSPALGTDGGYEHNWIDIRTSEDDLDPVTWLEVIDDVLLVFKKKSVNAIYDPSTFSFQRIANVGCEGRFQSCVLDDRCYFVSRSGVYSVTAQGAPRYESFNIEPLFKGTGPAGLEAIDLGRLASEARMCSLPNGRVYLAVTSKGALANRWLLECYPRLRGAVGDSEDPRTPWVKHSFAKRCIKAMCSYRTTDEEVDKVVAGLTDEAGASPELVYLFEGSRDGVEPISWQWRSGFKSLISEEPLERIRRINLLMKGKVVAKAITDGVVKAEAVLESSEEALEYFRPESRGRYHALDLSESGQVLTQIFKGEFALRGGKEER